MVSSSAERSGCYLIGFETQNTCLIKRTSLLKNPSDLCSEPPTLNKLLSVIPLVAISQSWIACRPASEFFTSLISYALYFNACYFVLGDDACLVDSSGHGIHYGASRSALCPPCCHSQAGPAKSSRGVPYCAPPNKSHAWPLLHPSLFALLPTASGLQSAPGNGSAAAALFEALLDTSTAAILWENGVF
jgi:hypothetical protein